ncbi:MAG: PSD1 and planctomycete cytochrome C domain-containing protein [Pirellulales bacterium]
MAKSLELFQANVRATLSSQCLRCHGGEKTEGELDLTTREGLLAGGTSGPAIIAGDPAKSRLLTLVRHQDEPHMPAEGDQLSDTVVQQFSDWIAAGAAYDAPLIDVAEKLISKTVSDEDRQFWSLAPLGNPPVPAVADAAWCRTPVDHFVLDKLTAHQLTPNPPAERRKLIRRAYLDVLGLPPTPAEIDQFLADESPDAYANLIDRLLDSPHYGERWGRHWLDLARFAESHGYEQDDDRPTAYHYRDFVIQALNQDMPYDQFVRWQIAGDEIAPDNNLALMATGFLAAGTHATQITANQVEKERYDELDDMTATIGTAMLGLTVGCARCHDHKFDPIPQGDYYRLVSTFSTTVRSEVDLDFDPERTRHRQEEFDRQHKPLAEALARFEAEQLPSRFEEWLASNVTPVAPKWQIVEAAEIKSESGVTFDAQDDASYLAKGNNASHDVYTFSVPMAQANLTAVRIDALPHPSLPKNGPGRAENGNFALSDFQLWAAPAGTAGPGAPVKLVAAKATFEQPGLPAASAIDDNRKSAWAIDPQVGREQSAAFDLETPLANTPGTTLTFVLRFNNNTGHNLGRLRLSLSSAAKPVALDGEQVAAKRVAQFNAALAAPPDQRTPEQQAALATWHREHDAEWQKLHAAVREHQAQAPQPELTKVLISSEGVTPLRLRTQGADFFEHTYYLKRGDLNQKLQPAEPAYLQVLTRAPRGATHWRERPPADGHTSYRRRALANWITDTDTGAGDLLARVIVNRLWQHHFGRGIVETPSDFGHAGAPPSHPQLLDYLARRLIAGGWRLKPIHKLMMTSAAYLQDSQSDPQRAAIDPDNRWLWHRSRLRLEAEVIRDCTLAASGELDTRMYGPGSLDPAQRRRSVYFTVKRSQLVPSMMLFDAPDALTGLGQRASTIVAPQALAMLNDAQLVERSRALARKLLAPEGTTAEAAIARGYLSTLGRPADEAELNQSAAFVRQATDSYVAASKENAAELALADFCQVLFGLNEFIYVD